MTDHQKMEFWNALGRLYDETLALKESIGELHQSIGELHQSTTELRESAADLRGVAEAHQRIVEAHQKAAEGHEKRLDRLEVVQQWCGARFSVPRRTSVRRTVG